MRLFDVVRTASSNTFRSKLRTSLTIIAIFIGSFTLTLTNGLGSGISSYIDKQVNNLGAKDVLVIQAGNTSAADSGVNTDDAPKTYDPSKKMTATEFGTTITALSEDDITKIEKVPGMVSVEPNLIIAADYISSPTSDKYQLSINPYIGGANIDLVSGGQLSNESKEKATLLPIQYVSALGFRDNQDAVGKTVSFGITDGTGKQHVITAKVSGVMQKSLVASGGAFTNKALTNEMNAAQITGLPSAASSSTQYLVGRFDKNYSEAQITDLKERLKKEGYKAQTVADQIGSFQDVITGIILVLNAFAVIALLAAGFGIINTLLMSVQERTREIGLMKAMGMSGGKIFLLFTSEAVLLGFWGSFIGVVVAEGVGRLANKLVADKYLSNLPGLHLVAFPIESILIIMGIVMGIAFLAGTLPATRAARQNPIDSLRYE